MNVEKIESYHSIPMSKGQIGAKLPQGKIISQKELSILEQDIKKHVMEDFDMDQALESLDNGIIVKIKLEELGFKKMGAKSVKWRVYEKNEENKKIGRPQFIYTDQTSECKKNYGNQCCNSLKLECFYDRQDKVVMKCHKKCKYCACCPHDSVRSSMECSTIDTKLNIGIKNNNEEQKYLGSVFTPYKPCFSDYAWKLYGEQSKVDYTIVGKFCQGQIWCHNCCCAKCNKAEFKIYHEEDLENEVGIIKRYSKYISKTLKIYGIEEYSAYVDFPKTSTWKQRAMIMNFIIYLDCCLLLDAESL